MAVTFGGLIYIQIMYMDRMSKMRNQQFSENVKRSLAAVSDFLERQETLHYLEEDVNDIETSFFGNVTDEEADSTFKLSPLTITYTNNTEPRLEARYKRMQDVIRTQYLYQKGLLNEVILNIMRESSNRSPLERADSSVVRNALATELSNNGLNLPFEFCLQSTGGETIYATQGYTPDDKRNEYSQLLFPAGNVKYYLSVLFPDKSNYIYVSVRWLIPTLFFTLILLFVFISTIIVAFRQKKLTEMKTDFMNNMTHELKTPISTISLASQMMQDDSVHKSESMLAHLSTVIGEESKRLRYLVEKVLQMSLYDKQLPNFKWTELDVNEVISAVIQNFKIKVENNNGKIEENLKATNALAYVDEMHFTNMIYNLLDNAVKYMREDVPPLLRLSTSNPNANSIEIRISDNGIGIKKEHLKRIFDKFYRVPTGNLHNVKGFGLGLAYVHNIVVGFHGRIRAESDYGKGTTFIITLPTAEAPTD